MIIPDSDCQGIEECSPNGLSVSYEVPSNDSLDRDILISLRQSLSRWFNIACTRLSLLVTALSANSWSQPLVQLLQRFHMDRKQDWSGAAISASENHASPAAEAFPTNLPQPSDAISHLDQFHIQESESSAQDTKDVWRRFLDILSSVLLEFPGSCPTQEVIDRIQDILKDKNQYKKLLGCRESEAQRILDKFQELLNFFQDTRRPGVQLNTPSNFQRNLTIAIQRLAEASGLLPLSYEVADVSVPETADHSGGFADIYRGIHRGCEVCVKIVRRYGNSKMAQLLKVISNEAVLWSQLRHPNVLPLIGIYRFEGIHRFKGTIALVAPWMQNGTITEYLMHHHTLNRVVLACDVARGLRFLHQNGVIHGDLSGKNVLVSDRGNALIMDFGLSSLSDEDILAWPSCSLPASRGGTVRYQAPELFDFEGEEARNTMSSDIFAFGMLAYEIITGEVPFANLHRGTVIMKRISDGERPARPADSSSCWGLWGLTEQVWSTMEACWSARPEDRPTIETVFDCLSSALPSNPSTDADEISVCQ